VVASESWSRLVPAGIVAAVLTFVSQGAWRGIWTWWAPMITLLALTLLFARMPLPWPKRLGPGPLGYFDGDRGDAAERAGDAG
jgi:O-antigen/teichoic acid export membrane protein